MADYDLPSFRLVGAAYTSELSDALSAPPVLSRKLDGGSTLTVEVADYRRLLVKSPTIAGKAYADVDGLHFELVAVAKQGNGVTLTFEDAITVELKRPRPKLTRPAGSLTRQQIAQLLAAEAGVRISVDPQAGRVYQKAFERDDNGSSWELLSTLASDIGWRCFSDGWQLFIGSDAWLATLSAPLPLSEQSDTLTSDVDFSMDVAMPASAASFDVVATRWALPPGRAVTLSDLGWADGVWLVSSFERPLTSQYAHVELVRRQLVLAEPPPDAGADSGESGEAGFVPDDTGGSKAVTATAKTGNAARDKMIAWAMSKRGHPYVWGGQYDCSAFVRAATAAGGKQLPGTSKSQYATCKAQGKLISVQDGLRTRGAILFRMSGEPTHVAISLGDGTTIEARGKAYGCNIFPGASKRTWTHSAIWL